jgi:hypothetical protein
VRKREKARQRRSPAGFKSLDLSGRLLQAMAVRRHGGSMMVGMAVMADALHLFETLRENPMACQMRLDFRVLLAEFPPFGFEV